MRATFSIDWLHLTSPFADSKPLPHYLYPTIGSKEITQDVSRYGYTECVRNKFGARAMWNRQRVEMGVHTSYPAGALNEYAREGHMGVDILSWSTAADSRCSRIDLAFDVYDSDLSIDNCRRLLASKLAHSVADRWNMIEGSDGGATLYIGSRSSDAMCRIYDKAVEQNVGGNWKRIELELKGRKAAQVGRDLSTARASEITRIARGYLAHFVHFPTDVWQMVIGDTPIPLAPANKHEPNTEQWLLHAAAPALGKYVARTGSTAVLQAFLRIVRIYRVTGNDSLTNTGE
jgi:hypothetical protein